MWMAMVVEIKLLPHHLMRPNVIFLCACIVMGHGLSQCHFPLRMYSNGAWFDTN